MSKKSITDAEKIEAIQTLRKWLKPGDTVYCVLRHVSASGMYRRISFMVPVKDRKGIDIMQIDGYIRLALGMTSHRDGGLNVYGCGMDMGFDVVHRLGRTLFPKGRGRNGDTSGHDPDGGYALTSRWL